MAQIVIADIEAYDPSLPGTRTLSFATQGYTVGASPTGDPVLPSSITFSRASTATRINRNGVMEIVGNNVARFDYDPVTLALRGLLIEGARTNLAVYSESFTNAVYLGGPADVTITDNAAISPANTSTASVFVEGLSSAAHTRYQALAGLTPTSAHVMTLFVRKIRGARGFAIGFGSAAAGATLTSANRGFARWDTLAAGAATATGASGTAAITSTSAVNMGNGWWRLTLAFTFDSGNTNASFAVGFGITNSDLATASQGDASSYAIYGLQLEVASVATSYIPTLAATVARSADTVTASASGGTSGTLFAQFVLASEIGERPVCSFDDTTSNNAYRILNSSGVGKFVVANGGVVQADLSLGTTVPFSRFAIAGAYAANDFAASMNGGSVSTDASGSLPTISRVQIGSAATALNGWVQRIAQWQTRLSNTQLQELSGLTNIPTGALFDFKFLGDVDTHYEGRIQQPANIVRTMFSSNATTGRSQIGFGNLVLLNNDGGLDYLLNYSFAGRPITIRLGDVQQNSNGVPNWVTLLRGTMEQAELSWQKVTIRVRDRLLDLAKPIQQTRYAGNNALPAGLEGVADDLKGKPKPLVFGSVWNVAPPCVNTDRRIYQLHAGSAIQSVGEVYDRGAPLTTGAAYASQADMEANVPAAGQYRLWNDATAGAFIRLGSAPTGLVTCDVKRGAAISNRTVGQLFNSILLAAGIPSSDISSSDITALDAAAPYETGVYAGWQDDVTPLQLLDELCISAGAWYGVDATGIFRVGRVELPTGASVGTITATDIIKIERVASRDPGVGIPAWKVKVGYKKLYNVQTDLAATVADARKSYFSNEYRRVEASDASVKTANVLSPEMEFLTSLTSDADATTEASRLLTIYKARRDMYEVTVRVDSALASILDLGKIITMQVNRFGMSAGKKFLIIGIRNNMRGYQFDLTLWG